ncbi:MAG: hypothetical protein VKJ24_07685 [Synechococcales bacterium]|nr:hypothetical protein [Synechococcales bacterium]
MKVIKRSPNTLIMLYRPWGAWLYCAVIAGLGAFLLVTGIHISTFSCFRSLQHPTSGSCELVHYRPWQSDRRNFPLQDIQGVTLVSQLDPKGRQYSQVTLATTTGPAELRLNWLQSHDQAQARANKIQAFLTNPRQPKLKIQEDQILLTIMLSLVIFVIAGVIFLATGAIRTLQFDRISGKVTLTTQRIREQTQVEYSLNRIVDVIIYEVGVARHKNDCVALVLDNRVQVSLYPSCAVFRHRRQRQRTVEQILEFLHLRE